MSGLFFCLNVIYFNLVGPNGHPSPTQNSERIFGQLTGSMSESLIEHGLRKCRVISGYVLIQCLETIFIRLSVNRMYRTFVKDLKDGRVVCVMCGS
jgi:hypothetical protein